MAMNHKSEINNSYVYLDCRGAMNYESRDGALSSEYQNICT